MAPRANIQQAIEFLKIHQIRRENAAIYSQIQNLRNEVSDLTDRNADFQKQLDENHSEIKVGRTVAARSETQLLDIAAKLDAANCDTVALQKSVKDINHFRQNQIQIFKHHNDQVLQAARSAQIACDENERRQNLLRTDTRHQFEDVQKSLKGKANTDAVDILETRLDKLEQRIGVILEEEKAGLEFVSRIVDSLEDANRPTEPAALKKGHCEDNLVDHNRSTDPPSTDQMLTLQPRKVARRSTFPDDVDLDGSVTSIELVNEHPRKSRSHESLVMLPHNTAQGECHVVDILQLVQRPQEKLTTYLQRGLRLLQMLPEDCTSIVLHRLIDGFAEDRHGTNFTMWFNSTSWSRQSFEDVARLHGMNKGELSADLREREAAQSLHVSNNHQTEVVVPGTSYDFSEQRIVDGQTLDSVSTVMRSRPRRSQRLAARSQTQRLTPTTDSLETESQAEAHDARIARAAQQCRAEQDAVRDAFSKTSTRTLENCRAQRMNPKGNRKTARASTMQVLTTAARDTSAGCKDNRSRLCTPDQVIRTVSHLAQDELAAEITVGSLFDAPRTPTRRIFPSRSRRAYPQTPNAKASIAPRGKKTVLGSPYNPRPRLVSLPHRANETGECLTSDPDLVLPRVDRSRKRWMVLDLSHGRETKKQKRHLPLPPPPEIPILVTSSED